MKSSLSGKAAEDKSGSQVDKAEGNRKINVLVASHAAMACELYLHALNRRSDFRVAACALTLEQVLCAVNTKPVDVALIAMALQDGPQSGLQAVQKISSSHPLVKSIILLEPDQAHLVAPAFRAGARGVLSPDSEGIKELLKCVKKVNEGQIWATSAQLAQVLEAFSHPGAVRAVNTKATEPLTRRERDVVQLVEEGLSNRQIAHELQLSEHTIKNYLFRIFEKLGVSTRVELALYAFNARNYAADAAPDHARAGSESKPLARNEADSVS